MEKSLLITYYFPPYTGGISNSLYNFCRNFPENQIVVLTNRKFNQPAKFQVFTRKIFIRSKWFWPKWLPLFFHAYIILKKLKINTIQVGQVLPIGYVAYVFKKILNIHYLVYLYGQDLIISQGSKRKLYFIKKILDNSNGIICNSNFTLNLAKKITKQNNMVVAFPCPLDIDRVVDRQSLANFKLKNNLDGKKVILTVGNLVERKGQDNVIRAIKSMSEEKENYHYMIVGNGPNEKKLKDMVRRLDLEKNVSFHNHVKDEELKYFYSACDIFAMPARILKDKQGNPVDVEGFGMVFLEANLFYKPTIGGNNGGQSESIENNKSGLLVNPENIKEIANSIKKLASDKKVSSGMGSYGHQRAISQFSWDKQTKKIIDMLDLISNQ